MTPSTSQAAGTLASPTGSLAGPDQTGLDVHDALWAVLAAQSQNATLSGADLREAAGDFVHVISQVKRTHTGPVLVGPVDAAGHRILGAACMLDTGLDELGQPWDHSYPFPDVWTCVLVGGAIAGPVGLADAAAAARDAGATAVTAAVLGGWDGEVLGVDGLHLLRLRHHVAA